MVKSELMENLARKMDIPHSKAEEAVNLFFDTITKALTQKERVEIRGFGAFTIREYKGYAGRNPKTGKSIEVKPKNLPFFKPGLELKQRVDSFVPED